VPDREPRNYDNDRTYINPAAWRKMKEAFKGQNHLDRLFRRLEGLARGGFWNCPRLQLAFALHHFTSMSRAERERAAQQYFRGFDIRDGKYPLVPRRDHAAALADGLQSPFEELSADELAEIAADFDAAVAKVLAEGGPPAVVRPPRKAG